MGTEILLYVPNLIGYFRLVLIIASSCLSDYPLYFVALYSLSSLLDGVDGIAARRLNQISAFGAWLDVVVDLVGRGMVWCLVSQRWGYYMAVLEWTTFICTHSRGPEWKSSFEEAPWFAQMVMAKGFKTPAGFLAVGSLHVLPVWVYGYQTDFMSQYLRIPLCGQYGGMAVLVLGRLLCMSVEIYCIVDYVLHMVHPQTTTVTVITSKGESSNPVKPK